MDAPGLGPGFLTLLGKGCSVPRGLEGTEEPRTSSRSSGHLPSLLVTPFNLKAGPDSENSTEHPAGARPWLCCGCWDPLLCVAHPGKKERQWLQSPCRAVGTHTGEGPAWHAGDSSAGFSEVRCPLAWCDLPWVHGQHQGKLQTLQFSGHLSGTKQCPVIQGAAGDALQPCLQCQARCLTLTEVPSLCWERWWSSLLSCW